jgi:ketosteroid isomerase-like protein
MKTIMTKALLSLFFLPVFVACNSGNEHKNHDSLKQEIANTEKEFETAAKKKGIAEAFYFFADENAVIKRQNDSLIKGKENIKKYYQNPVFKTASVSWTPDFVDVSVDGTLGYTFGKYLWKTIDKNGRSDEFKGVFHTVWKKQSNGTWKYVWD